MDTYNAGTTPSNMEKVPFSEQILNTVENGFTAYDKLRAKYGTDITIPIIAMWST